MKFSFNKALEDSDYTLLSSHLVSKTSEDMDEDVLEEEGQSNYLGRRRRGGRRRRSSWSSYNGSGCRFCGDRRTLNFNKLGTEATDRALALGDPTSGIISKWQESLKNTLMGSRYDVFQDIESLTIEVEHGFSY